MAVANRIQKIKAQGNTKQKLKKRNNVVWKSAALRPEGRGEILKLRSAIPPPTGFPTHLDSDFICMGFIIILSLLTP